jgi:DNA-binding MarR family transcriptional regulator
MIVTRRRPDDESNFAQLLSIPFEAYEEELHHRLAEAGYPDIRPPHGPVFMHLTRQGLRLHELGEKTRLTKQMVNYLINSLEELGYVERLSDPQDRRGRIVRLTDRGEDAARAIRAAGQEIEAEWTARIGAAEMRYLRLLLRRVVTVAEEQRRERQAGQAQS